jgi:hypothetical protein
MVVGSQQIEECKVSDNPFQTPQQMSSGQPPIGSPNQGRSYVSQVPVIAALMIAQGVLLLIYALVIVAYAIFFTQMDAFMPPEAQAEFEAQMAGQTTILAVVAGVFAAGILILSIMHFVAAYLGFKYKRRVFGIVTLIMGLGSMFTCYCAPTAIGLAVYGMIIYFNPAVAQAFTFGNAGMSKQEIMARFPN